MMIQFLSNFVKRTFIISGIGSSLMIITISQAGGPPPGTKPPAADRQEDTSEPSGNRGKPVEVEPETTEPTRRQPPTQQSETTQPPPQFPEPAGRVAPVEGLITLRLINQTGAVIEYQVIGGRHRTLGETSVVELSELPIPLTLTYQRSDGGLLMVRPRSISPRLLEVIFNPTEDFDLDTKSLNITGKGGVFLN
ncbi:MAG: hypothetical protein F6K22_28675 [Okeania sp. SIO2F4]|uniref:hypothetical protein n=1 Tax=Okeania sp. SIO2F4 TaxID=2607790 RepID=UPI00142C3BFC|nr:hypothetical protein [Okeania sp. SIO2F4]NES06440.1 hypothetical protein [Okeania sp. SIO2F4]